MKAARLLFIILATLAVVLPVRFYVIEPVYIASASMEPTLTKGMHLFLDKLAFRFRAPRRGEIISFKSPVGEPHDSVKRVIAVAGDVVEIKNKKVIVNGKELYEPYTRYSRPDESLAGDNLGPVTVPPRHLFVLGDNRDESRDSSTWKNPDNGERIYFIPLSALDGKIRGSYRKE